MFHLKGNEEAHNKIQSHRLGSVSKKLISCLPNKENEWHKTNTQSWYENAKRYYEICSKLLKIFTVVKADNVNCTQRFACDSILYRYIKYHNLITLSTQVQWKRNASDII